jgi:hypothetical protein
MKYLIQFLQQILSWTIDFFKWIFEWVWQQLLGALITVLNAIPVPSWLASGGSLFGALPEGAAFFINAFMLPQGLAIIIGAFTIRFIIRRIPLIG